MDIKTIASLIKAEIIHAGKLEFEINQIILDSRKIIFPSQSIFFAINGERHNAHDYLIQVYEQGLRNFVVSEAPNLENFPDCSILLVPDTVVALQQLAKAHRDQFALPIIGITGSNGKTTVKEWLFQLLQDDYNIVRSPRSYNSQVGVPLSVFAITQNHDLGIFEAGISKPNEMQKIAPIISPTIGIFTNIGDAHNEGFKNLAEKIDEKLVLFNTCLSIIYCADINAVHQSILNRFSEKKLITWAYTEDAVYQISNIDDRVILFKKAAEEWSFIFPFHDQASKENLIHTIIFLLERGYAVSTIQERLNGLFKLDMRMDIKEGINGCTIINDAYNFDLAALKIVLSQLENEDQLLKKTVIISDILEHKNDSKIYSKIAHHLNTKNITKVIGIGTAIKQISPHLDPTIKVDFYQSADQFLDQQSQQNFKNELILLKGARPFGFEKISAFLSKKSHHTILEIDLDAIGSNLKYFNSLIKPTTKIMAMIKASAYGSGSLELAKYLSFQKVDYLGVANADEGVELRKAGIQLPILVLNPEKDIIDVMLNYRLEPEIYSLDLLKSVERFLTKNNVKMGVHLNLNTGMNRLGFDEVDGEELLKVILESDQLYIQSIFSHLASSEKEEDDDKSLAQIRAFEERSAQIIEVLTRNKGYQPIRHILNSSGIIRFTKYQYEMVRLGIGLYGIGGSEESFNHLTKVHTLKAKILQIRDLSANTGIGYNFKGKTLKPSKIATVGIGYADGIIRQCGNGNFHFWVNKQKAPIIGNVSMDMTTIDISKIEGVKVGDDVVIFDNNDSLEALSKACNTISYEILSRISNRVKRVFYQE